MVLQWLVPLSHQRRKNDTYSEEITSGAFLSLSFPLRTARQDPNTDLLSRPSLGESTLRNDLHSISLLGFHADNLVAVRKTSLCAE